MTGNTYYNNLLKRLGLLNRYYKITRFYTFLKDTAFKAGMVVIVFVLLLLGLEYFVLDINSLLNSLVETYSPQVIFTFFLISETILGIVPPEIFIAWASKSPTPWLFLFILATLSYIGGIISYLIGSRLFLITSVKNHIENKIAVHIVNLRKWGSIFVVLGAISPIPHSIVSLACGLIKYSFKQYLLWALFRYLRFIIYAFVIFQVFAE
ncbi:YqaA family protein [Arcticibacterium luteifluviistationis]|uniref:Short-chain dehydrogenase n=1 Tax=Arcticibacterium luteifluviistationis TaxID=1784714 RepID=A0A2Z4G860_9BACT|nr:VTT domain-containing protein [Arcticibacterium luteifluviistationis]AWV97243.1 short-chain dehydrogenase [Arcticibacterium luteifluviistationis]